MSAHTPSTITTPIIDLDVYRQHGFTMYRVACHMCGKTALWSKNPHACPTGKPSCSMECAKSSIELSQKQSGKGHVR